MPELAAALPVSAPAWPPVGQLVSLSRRGFRGRQPIGTGPVRWHTGSELAVELAPGAAEVGRRARAVLEWVDPHGLARGDVRAVSHDGLLVVELRSVPDLIQRRQHVRVPLVVPVRVWSLLAATSLIQGETVNISQGGLLAHLPGVPAAATLLSLQIVAEGMAVNVTGEIVRREGDLIAVHFEQLRPEDQRRLVELLGDERLVLPGT